MNKEVNFETYLYISRNRYKLYVDDKTNFRNLYKRELNIDDKINVDDLDSLSNFLNDNIYKIEKLLGEFIKDITLIIENDQILNIDIGIKKKKIIIKV